MLFWDTGDLEIAFIRKKAAHAKAQRCRENLKMLCHRIYRGFNKINVFLCAFAPLRENGFYIIDKYNKKLRYIHRRLRGPVRLSVFDHDIGINTATYAEFGPQAHETRLAGCDQVIENAVGHILVKGALVAK